MLHNISPLCIIDAFSCQYLLNACYVTPHFFTDSETVFKYYCITFKSTYWQYLGSSPVLTTMGRSSVGTASITYFKLGRTNRVLSFIYVHLRLLVSSYVQCKRNLRKFATILQLNFLDSSLYKAWKRFRVDQKRFRTHRIIHVLRHSEIITNFSCTVISLFQCRLLRPTTGAEICRTMQPISSLCIF